MQKLENRITSGPSGRGRSGRCACDPATDSAVKQTVPQKLSAAGCKDLSNSSLTIQALVLLFWASSLTLPRPRTVMTGHLVVVNTGMRVFRSCNYDDEYPAFAALVFLLASCSASPPSSP